MGKRVYKQGVEVSTGFVKDTAALVVNRIIDS